MKASLTSTYISLILLFLISVPLTTHGESEKLEAIKFAVTDIAGLEELQREFGAFKATLEKVLGREVMFFPITSRTAIVEAIKNAKVDLVLTGPAEYIIMNKRSNATPLVGFERPNYLAALIVLADSPIKTVADLKGKKVAFADVGSTAYHLAPLKLITTAGLSPDDVKIVHVGKQVQYEALKRKHIDAIGYNYARFLQIVSEDTSVTNDSFRILSKSKPLPNDVLVAGSHLSPELLRSIKSLFVKNSDDLIKALLVGKRNDKYTDMHFIGDIKDSDYNYIRQLYGEAGYPEFS